MKDFKIEDVWLLPIELDEHHDLNDVLEQLVETKKKISEAGLVGKLLKLRLYLGNIFSWDSETATAKNNVCAKIGERYANAEGLNLEDLPQNKIDDFVPVYYLENESLLELEKNILQAAIHLGKIQGAKNKYLVNMTVYVKPKGIR